MLFRREGFPEENELVMCTVTKVHFNSVFVNLDEYLKQGMIHISEVSPGRIRNIRDFVKEGKVVVCKVLRINRERGHIDLSLRRVSEAQRRARVDEMKQEQKSEKIVEFVAKNLKKEPGELYKGVFAKVSGKYGMLSHAFNAVVEEDLSLENLGIEATVAQSLEAEIRQRIRPREVTIRGTLMLKSYEPNGVQVVREALKKGLSVSPSVKIRCSGAGKYHVDVTSSDYPEAEELLEKVASTAVAYAEAHKSVGSFVREEH